MLWVLFPVVAPESLRTLMRGSFLLFSWSHSSLLAVLAKFLEFPCSFTLMLGYRLQHTLSALNYMSTGT